MNFRAVVFDLDGTLIDSLADLATAVNRVLSEHGFPEHPQESFRTLVGDGVHTLFRRALPEEAKQNRALIEGCVAGFHREYDECWHDQSRLYDGVAEWLDHLVSQTLPLAVLSNKPHDFTVKCNEHFLAAWPFEQVLGQRDGIPHKPDPAGALEIAAAFDVPPADCLYVGAQRVIDHPREMVSA